MVFNIKIPTSSIIRYSCKFRWEVLFWVIAAIMAGSLLAAITYWR